MIVHNFCGLTAGSNKTQQDNYAESYVQESSERVRFGLDVTMPPYTQAAQYALG